MVSFNDLVKSQKSNKDVCISYCITTHTILRDSKVLFKFNISQMSTLCKLDSMIPKCHYMLPSETMLHVSIVLYFSKFKRNLLNFKIIHATIKLLILDAFYM